MDLFKQVTALAKRRGFIFPGSEIYGGLANTYDYGPLGVELKNNIKKLWWQNFVHEKENIYGLDGGIILNPKVWEASGHVKSFVDPLVECLTCHNRFRLDQIPGVEAKTDYYVMHDWPVRCPSGEDHDLNLVILRDKPKNLTEVNPKVKPKMFNGMFVTYVGATREKSTEVYLRPETAQVIFINFKNIVQTFSPKIPFGIAQIGKAFRNEITPGQFIFRTLEFEQMEIEYFIKENDWEKTFENWKNEMINWVIKVGVDKEKVRFREHSEKERSHYSKRTIDLEFCFSEEFKELCGLAYRGNYDLNTHQQHSGVDLTYKETNGEQFIPHVVEPSFGVDRILLAILLSSFKEDNSRIVLQLKPSIAPYKVAVFPLLSNKPELIKVARKIYKDLSKQMAVRWDDNGNIGKRYRRQDEAGTPWCVTVDFATLKTDDVTVRDRDSMKQERIKISKLAEYFKERL